MDKQNKTKTLIPRYAISINGETLGTIEGSFRDVYWYFLHHILEEVPEYSIDDYIIRIEGIIVAMYPDRRSVIFWKFEKDHVFNMDDDPTVVAFENSLPCGNSVEVKFARVY